MFKRFLVGVSLCFLGLNETGTARAESATQVSAAIRPTLRRSYVFFGTSDKQIDLPDLVAAKAPEKGSGVANAFFEPLRFELMASKEVIPKTALFLRVMGGKWKLKLYDEQEVQTGQDFNFELGALHESQITSSISVDLFVGARVRTWSFKGGEIPKHGNTGILIGITPRWGALSLTVENTLAAAWLYDLNDLGAQKDSSVLRIRPEISVPVSYGDVHFGVEYYHTHTEFFGSKVIPKQSAFMLDDFELAAIVGTAVRF
jgi:hypothetical protein